MRLLICAGGTGGGVYPALAVLQALRRADWHALPEKWELEVLWVGGAGGMEAELVARENIPFTAIPAAGVHGVGLRSLPGNLWRLSQGLFAARRVLRRYRPDVLLFTGGYVAVPVAMAARMPSSGKRPRSLVYVPDIEPGMALKVLARFADRIALSAERSKTYFNDLDRVVITGYPCRQDLQGWDREAACKIFDLDGNLPVLLVFGGSKGARSINRSLQAILPELLPHMQILHISGRLDWSASETMQKDLRASLPLELVRRYHPFPYLHAEMGAALAAADLVLSRAGASTMGEFPLFGVPAILVPYPYAWRYQKVNADYLADHGAAMVLRDDELPARMASLILELLGDKQRLEQMRVAMGSLARPLAAQAIAEQLLAMSPMHGGEQ